MSNENESMFISAEQAAKIMQNHYSVIVQNIIVTIKETASRGGGWVRTKHLQDGPSVKLLRELGYKVEYEFDNQLWQISWHHLLNIKEELKKK